MKQFWTLTWVQLKVHMGLADLFSSLRGSKKDKMRGIGYIVLFVLVVGSLISAMAFLMDALFQAAQIPVLQQTVLALILVTGMMVALMFGIFYAISLYYSKDNEFLMSLPLKRTAVFTSKFVVALIGEIGTFALLAVPALVVFSLHANVDFSFYCIGLLVVLFGPFIPFAIANIMAAIIMRISVLSKYRNQIAIVGGFVFLAAYLFLNQYLSSNFAQMNSDDVMILLSGGFVKIVTAAFPPARWAAAALVFKGTEAITGLLLFVGVSALAFVLCIVFSGRMFNDVAASQGETRKNNRRVDIKDLARKMQHPAISVFKKEWKMLMRSPTYAMNSLLSILMAPLMVAVMVLTPVEGLDSGFLGALTTIPGVDFTKIFLLGGAGYCYLMASINTACSTMYSREGEAIWIVQMVPVSAKSIYLGKLLCSLSISFLAVITTSFAFMFLLNIPVLTALGAAMLGMWACVPMLIVMLFIDMMWPRLHWDSERKAMKSNINALLGMMAAFLFAFLLTIGILALMNAGVSILLIVAIVIFVCLCIAVPMYALSIKQSQKLTDRMGER